MRCGELLFSSAALVAGYGRGFRRGCRIRHVVRLPRSPPPRSLRPSRATPSTSSTTASSRNADGSLTLAYGYHNVNRVDVTVEREDNAFLTGAADRDQPTVFLPGRQRFACVLVVPEAFDGRLQWRVRFAGHESVTTARVLDPLYALEEASARAGCRGESNWTAHRRGFA